MPGPLPPGFDISALSDADLLHLAGADAPQQAEGPSGAIDIKSLSDKDIAALSASAGHGGPKVPTGEAAARLFYKHLTFGTEPGADKARSEQAAAEHPYVNIASAVPAFVAQTAALGPLAAAGKAAQGAGIAARAARGAGAAADFALLPNTEARTALEATRTGAKLGGNYSALETLGSDLTNPNKTAGETTRDVALSYGLGSVGGGVLGAGAHGLSRAIGAGANRISPELKPVLEAARSPEGQGARDIMRQLGYDKYTEADLRNVLEAMRDPAQAHHFDNLNLIEALERKPLSPMPGTGELKPGVRVSPNLRDYAQDAANTGGQGRQEAIDRFANRRNEMSARIQGEIDALNAGSGARTPTVEDLPKLINEHFGTVDREAEAAALKSQQQAFNARWEALKSKPSVLTNELGEMYKASPQFRAAVQKAAERDTIDKIAAATEAGKPVPTNAAAMAAYARGGATRGGEFAVPGAAAGELPGGLPINILSPSHITSIHHELTLAAKPQASTTLSAQREAQQLKDWFGTWAERQFPGKQYGKLRQEYAVFKQAQEAGDYARNLTINGTGEGDRAALEFLRAATGEQGRALQQLEKNAKAYENAYGRYVDGVNKSAQGEKQATAVRFAKAQYDARSQVVDNFRKEVGERWQAEVARDQGGKLVQQAVTPAGRSRLMQILGPERGPSFIDNLLAIEARNQARTMPLDATASHQGVKFLDRLLAEGQTNAAWSFRKARAEHINELLSKASSSNAAGVNSIIDKLLTQAGKASIIKTWGPQDGRKFIEQLYNKQAQAGFSKTLYGGPDTAYKLARNKKTDALMDAVHGILHLRPMQTLKALGELGSSAYKQRRADQANVLLSRQGTQEVAPVIESMLSGQQLRQTAHPFIRNPLLNAVGPVGAVDTVNALAGPQKKHQR